MTRSLRLLALSLLFVVAACARAQTASGTFDRTLNVGEPLELDVQTGSGAIEVRAGAAGKVEVHGEIRVGNWKTLVGARAGAEEVVEKIKASPPIELEGNHLRIGQLDEAFWKQNASISYTIVAPAATQLRARTGSGSQTARGLAGPVVLESGSGSVTLEDIAGAAEVRTGSGSIQAHGIGGAFTGSAGSGHIEVAQTGHGDVAASTGSGSVELKGVDGAARVRTGSGSVTVDGKPAGPWELETGSGSVNARMAPDAAFTIDAKAGSGGVRTSLAVTIAGSVERGQLQGQVRGGGPTVRIRTGSGGITID
jgi:DUF4097 and DUF4098 domain-containing protein YvlB